LNALTPCSSHVVHCLHVAAAAAAAAAGYQLVKLLLLLLLRCRETFHAAAAAAAAAAVCVNVHPWCASLTDNVVLWPASEVLLALVAHQHQLHVQAHAGQLTVAGLSLAHSTTRHKTAQAGEDNKYHGGELRP
jgi:hypothetical protein